MHSKKFICQVTTLPNWNCETSQIKREAHYRDCNPPSPRAKQKGTKHRLDVTKNPLEPKIHLMTKKRKRNSDEPSSSRPPPPPQSESPSLRSLLSSFKTLKNARPPAASIKNAHPPAASPPPPSQDGSLKPHPIKAMMPYHPSRLSPLQNYLFFIHSEIIFTKGRACYPTWRNADRKTLWYKINEAGQMKGWRRSFIKDESSIVRETYMHNNANYTKYGDEMVDWFRFVTIFFTHADTAVERMRERHEGRDIPFLTIEDKGYMVYSLFPALFEKLYYFYELQSEVDMLMMLNVSCERKWTYSTRDSSNYNDKVIIVSYNILGVANARKHPELYTRPGCLDWENRKLLICDELKRYECGILCFQEVDHFDDLNDLLKTDGFKGVHKARTNKDGDDACDGCTVFWRTNLFTLLEEANIEFQNYGLGNNVAQLCVFKMNQSALDADATAEFPCDTSRKLVVGNIHVLYNPKRGDIKLGQMRIFLEKAHELSKTWGGIPIVLAGDLNSLPQSAMYKFLASSKLDLKKHNRSEISGQLPQSHSKNKWTPEERERATGKKKSHDVRHSLKLSSAYKDIPGSEIYRDSFGEPVATSHHRRFTGTVDYIWHTPGIVALKVLETLPMQRLKETRGLPAERWGSDHLALACELAFTDADHP